MSASCVLVGGSDQELRHPEDPLRRVTLEDIALRNISAGELSRHMDFLRSVRARAAPESGAGRVGAWLGSRFQLAGVDPAGQDGGYVQYWPAGRPDDTGRSANVVALLPGADPARAGEYVIVLVRFGHLRSPVEDSAGRATGNEEGARTGQAAARATDAIVATAVLAEVARVLAALPARLPRPVLFLAVSCEEGTWAGASWFAVNPTVDLSATAAVLAVGQADGPQADGPAAGGAGGDANADGGAPPVRPSTLTVAGAGYSSLGPLLEQVVADHPSLGLGVRPGGPETARMLVRGDLAAFTERGIPVVLVAAQPGEPGEEVGPEGGEADAELAARLARLVFLTTHRIASAQAPPVWTEAGRRAVGDR